MLLLNRAHPYAKGYFYLSVTEVFCKKPKRYCKPYLAVKGVRVSSRNERATGQADTQMVCQVNPLRLDYEEDCRAFSDTLEDRVRLMV